MSAEAGFSETPFFSPTPPRGGNKRKRGPSAGQGGNRASPLSRRGQMNNHGPEEGSMMPAPSIHDLGDHDFLAGNGPNYLPNLAPSPHRQQSGQETNDSTIDTAAQALNFTMSVPPHPHDTFLADNGLAGVDQGPYPNNDGEGSPVQLDTVEAGEEQEETPVVSTKPQTGSEEWQRQRKNNHKEVERRRRETINEGINELQKVVPGCEKAKENKGTVVSRAVAYIAKLHDEASQNIDKWTFEKLVTEQAISDLSSKLHRAWKEKEAWKKLAKEAGVDVDNVILTLAPDNEDQADKDDHDGDTEVQSDGDREIRPEDSISAIGIRDLSSP